jgi:hypothetical protein
MIDVAAYSNQKPRSQQMLSSGADPLPRAAYWAAVHGGARLLISVKPCWRDATRNGCNRNHPATVAFLEGDNERGVDAMKHFASIALAASLTVGTVLAAMSPAAAMPLASQPSPGMSGGNVILVQEHGSRRSQDWGHGRREYWREHHYSRPYRNHHGWDRRRYWRDDWRHDRRYHHRRGGVVFQFRL